ncbi:MAG TPA: glycosyl hydrolase family 65 protein [Steroidobacteraceae bacterium]|nr:glycosyl hydrolase family 65 protein [Steroidobacteraceae bacterium]
MIARRSAARHIAGIACGVLGALVPIVALAGQAETDAGFRLHAGFADLPTYFPGLLGNGYIATLTAPRGSEATQTYLVGLMDYSPGDVSRPALIPGWAGIDFAPGSRAENAGWLNEAPLTAEHFQDYAQSLDMQDATLTTAYRYADHGRETAVKIVTFVSEASPHLAVTRFSITPGYDGEVRLSFPLTVWPRHTRRFAVGQLSGPAQDRALAAAGLALQPHPPATPDRAAIWYPGHTALKETGGDPHALTLWLSGRAEGGLTMAMAAAIALPANAESPKVTLSQVPRHLALDVTLHVTKGRTYDFTKYLALSRADWGGGAVEDVSLALEARGRGFDELASAQRSAWRTLWQSDILIEGDPRAQQVAHAELYYLLASSTADTAWATGPCGLTLCYAGHVFWDSDTWMFPALLLLHPRRAESILAFRARTLEAARQRAAQHGYRGAMYPWESDPQYGTDQTPFSAHVLSESEIHVNADVAIAQWQYYLATLDRNWLRARGWPVIREVARFFASRATYDADRKRYDILHVTSVAESNADIPDDTFTNLGAIKALDIAAAAAKALGERPDRDWSRIARGLYVPMAPDGTYHLAFAPSVTTHGTDFGGGPVALLFLPALDFAMPAALRRSDYQHAIRRDPMRSVGEVSMGILPRVAAADAVGLGDQAATWARLFQTGGTLKPPYDVCTETASNEVGPFLTGSGSYLQSLIYGLTGLRIRAGGLVDAYAPALPPGWRSLTLRNVTFRGRHMTLRVTRDPAGAVRLDGLH